MVLRKLDGKKFERNPAAQLSVFRAIDYAHPARAKFI